MFVEEDMMMDASGVAVMRGIFLGLGVAFLGIALFLASPWAWGPLAAICFVTFVCLPPK